MSLIDKVVQVIFRGKDEVSTAAKSAGDSTTGFSDLAKKAITGLAALGVGAVVGGFFKRAIEESIEASNEMARLKVAVDNSGASFDGMKPRVLDTIQQLNRMSTFTQSELRQSLANMVVMTGDAEGSLNALGLAADLAAARNIPLEQASEAVAKAMAGNETALRKLVPELKTSTDLFGDLQTKVGGAAEQMGNTLAGQIARAKDQFGEFANAVGDAIMGTEGLSNGGSAVINMLIDLQDWVAANEGNIQAMVRAFLDFARVAAALLPPIDFVTKGIELLGIGFERILIAVQRVSYAIAASVGDILSTLGTMVEKGGSLLKVFGVDVVEGLGSRLKKAGDDMAGVNKSKMLIVEYQYTNFLSRVQDTADRWAKGQTKAAEEASTGVTTHLKTTTKVTEDELKKQEAAYLKQHKAYLETLKLLYSGAVTTTEAMKQLGPAVQKSMDPARIETFNSVMTKSKDLADELWGNIKKTASLEISVTPWEQLKAGIKGNADELVGMARTGLDVAQSFGAIGRESASALTSVINIGESIAKIATGNPIAGISGILGGVANIVSVMMNGDAERKRLLKQNNDALHNLRKDIGGLNLRITGEDLVSAQTALQGVVGQLKGGRGAANENDVRNALYAQGLSMEDFDRIAKEFGIEIRSKSGALNVDSVKAVLEALKTVQLGKVGGGFGDQLDFFQESQDLGGEEGLTRASNLLKFLTDKGGVGALSGLDLSDPNKLRAQLLGVRAQLNSAEGIDETKLGKLTGSQFNDLLVQLIGLLGEPGAAGAGAGVPTGEGPSGVGTVSSGSQIDGTGGATMTLQDVWREQTAVVVDVLTEHTTLHTRVADATEGTFATLLRIERQLASVARATGGVDMIDRELEASRYALAVQQGTGAAF